MNRPVVAFVFYIRKTNLRFRILVVSLFRNNKVTGVLSPPHKSWTEFKTTELRKPDQARLVYKPTVLAEK